ncbi:phage holin family protein [Nakamurella aerolata]|uniref:Phage holin family protein n=1 Tax=Nakamurella aerolata TaxID=1656892 RepID=A0A849A4D5_9ACTN|nr:phage holin family protein [Nakamurella aerolata]NNG35415.1 phage holin family protein [Nakamurella aerolata]
MLQLIARTVATALAVALATWLIPGITLVGEHDTKRVLTLLAVALIIGVINAVVRPVVTFLTGCLVLLTLGLFLLVINAAMLLLASWVAEKLSLGFGVDGFWPALWGSLIISIVGALVYRVLNPERRG